MEWGGERARRVGDGEHVEDCRAHVGVFGVVEHPLEDAVQEREGACVGHVQSGGRVAALAWLILLATDRAD